MGGGGGGGGVSRKKTRKFYLDELKTNLKFFFPAQRFCNFTNGCLLRDSGMCNVGSGKVLTGGSSKFYSVNVLDLGFNESGDLKNFQISKRSIALYFQT